MSRRPAAGGGGTGDGSAPAGPVVAVVGPTAAGKSTLAVALADQLAGEVVNADSMQLYRGMDVGTAKPTVRDRRGVPHHLIDVWDVTVTASVARYQRLARSCLAELHARGRLPVVVGGSGLYLRAGLDDLRFPGTGPALRAALEAELAATGAGPMHARLALVDPAAASAILPSNGRRIVRALEVAALTGGPFPARQPPPRAVYPVVWLGLDLPAGLLDQRIAARVDRMWRRGLVAEVRRLTAAGLRDGRTASRAIGYREVLAALAGRTSLDAARSRTVLATRRLARRQRAWFGRDPRIRWLAADRTDLVERAAELVHRAAPTIRT